MTPRQQLHPSRVKPNPAHRGFHVVANRASTLPDDTIVILDSGATTHMCPDRTLFRNYITLEEPIPISWGNNSSNSAIGRGDLYYSSYNDNQEYETYLENVLHVPALGYQTLISLSQLEENHYRI